MLSPSYQQFCWCLNVFIDLSRIIYQHIMQSSKLSQESSLPIFWLNFYFSLVASSKVPWGAGHHDNRSCRFQQHFSWHNPQMLISHMTVKPHESPFDITRAPFHKSHNASDKYPTMHHVVTEMCTHVHISVTTCCIMGYTTVALWDFATSLYKYIILAVWEIP